jgi:hypothetical protein
MGTVNQTTSALATSQGEANSRNASAAPSVFRRPRGNTSRIVGKPEPGVRRNERGA